MTQVKMETDCPDQSVNNYGKSVAVFLVPYGALWPAGAYLCSILVLTLLVGACGFGAIRSSRREQSIDRLAATANNEGTPTR